MGVGRQFKRIGETAVAYGLWAMIIWVFTSVRRFVIFCLLIALFLMWIIPSLSDTGDKFYVQTPTLDLFDKPMGAKKRTLQINDTLTLIKEMSEKWVQVAVDQDTLYLKNDYLHEDNLGYSQKIEKTPFCKWKALSGVKATIHHPDGYFDTGDAILKNGNQILISKASEHDSMVHFKVKDFYKSKIHLRYVIVNWEQLFKKYPHLER